MSEQLGAVSTWPSKLAERFSDRDRRIKAVSLFFAAIGLTVVGDIGFQILTGDIRDYSPLGILWRIVLVVIAVLAVAAGIDELVELFRRPDAEVSASKLVSVKPKPALVVIASAQKNPDQGPHWTAYRSFSTVADSKLKYVYVVHSNNERSKASAEALVKEVDANKALGAEAFMQGLDTDFEDPEAVLGTIQAAIALASAKVGGPENVVLESTGGTSMASVGAALAKLDNPKITLTYIPQPPEGGFGDTPKEVPISVELTGRYHSDG